MKEQLLKEKDTDESDYEKMQCWCEVNNKEKNAAITNSIAAPEEQRAKQNKENQGEMVELTKNIEALKGAITVLKKHQLTAFPQMKLNFLSVATKKNVLAPGDELDKLSNWMTAHRFASLNDASEQDIE